MFQSFSVALLVAISSALPTYSSVKPITETPNVYTEEVLSLASSTASTTKILSLEVERLARIYKVSTSTAMAIIKCESTMYGKAVNENIDSKGKIWSRDWGYFQVNDYFHESAMNLLGLDIHKEWDSLEYGFILLKQQGTSPWLASKTCWSKK